MGDISPWNAYAGSGSTAQWFLSMTRAADAGARGLARGAIGTVSAVGGRLLQPCALRFKAQSGLGVARGELFFAEGDLFRRTESLAADAFGNLLDLAAGLQESRNLLVDRIAGFNGWSGLCFAVGCFYAHGGH